jgi:hypothetical protein
VNIGEMSPENDKEAEICRHYLELRVMGRQSFFGGHAEQIRAPGALVNAMRS